LICDVESLFEILEIVMDHTRHIGIFDASGLNVTLIGAGGIGALTAVVLAKMGVSYLTVYDDDTVDDVNLPTQFFQIEDLGKNKTHAVADLARNYSDEITVQAYPTRFDDQAPGLYGSDLIISAVDSITSRQKILKAVNGLDWDYYFDARMGAEIFQLYVVKKGDELWYQKGLMSIDESDVKEAPCTMKATIYTAAIAAGHIGAAVRKYITGGTLPRLISHNIADHILLVP
jgi:molybdopterin/thiamine biosynthesis adenylyltransferase